MSYMRNAKWVHCEIHNIDYPSDASCPKCDKEWNPDNNQVMTIEESLKKAKEDNDQHKPHKESEVLIVNPLQIRLKLREFYWKIRSEILEWLNYIYANVTGEF